MSIHQSSEMSIYQFVNSPIKRLTAPVLILLAVVVLVAGCGGPGATPPPPPASTATAFVLTQSGAERPYGLLSAVALPGGRLLWTATIPGQNAVGLVVAPRLGRGYVLAGPPFALTPVSLSTGTVGKPIRVGSAAWSVALAPDGTTAYVANAGDAIAYMPGAIGSTITPVNLRTGRAGPAINVGDGPCGIAFAGDGTAYVSLPLSGHLARISLATARAGPGAAVPSAGIGQADAPCAMAVSEGAGLLAVGNLQQDIAFPAPVVNLLDLASHRWRRPITLPGTSNSVHELGFSPDAPARLRVRPDPQRPRRRPLHRQHRDRPGYPGEPARPARHVRADPERPDAVGRLGPRERADGPAAGQHHHRSARPWRISLAHLWPSGCNGGDDPARNASPTESPLS
jgi:hypothetical protein